MIPSLRCLDTKATLKLYRNDDSEDLLLGFFWQFGLQFWIATIRTLYLCLDNCCVFNMFIHVTILHEDTRKSEFNTITGHCSYKFKSITLQKRATFTIFNTKYNDNQSTPSKKEEKHKRFSYTISWYLVVRQNIHKNVPEDGTTSVTRRHRIAANGSSQIYTTSPLNQSQKQSIACITEYSNNAFTENIYGRNELRKKRS